MGSLLLSKIKILLGKLWAILLKHRKDMSLYYFKLFLIKNAIRLTSKKKKVSFKKSSNVSNDT